MQPKTASKVSVPESSKLHNKFIPVPNYIIPQTRSGVHSNSRTIKRKTIQDISREIPAYTYPIYRPPPKPAEIPLQEIPGKLMDLDTDINTDFKENSAYQEGVISETYQKPSKSYFIEPPELYSLISTGKLMQKFLPKQAGIDKILKIIQRKVLKGTHLPVNVKEIQAGYLISPYFKDLYLYLAQNKLSSTKTAIYKVETLAEKYILLDSLLFKLVTTPEKETALLAIPETCVDKIITLYHSSIFAGHQGVIKMYLTTGDKFLIPGLIHYL